MRIKNIFLLIGIIFLVSCSARVQKEEYDNISVLPPYDDEFYTLKINSSISVEFPDITQSVSADILLSGVDSAAITLKGPFSIPIGKFFCDNDHFLFYNSIKNLAFEGKPDSANLSDIIHISMDFKDFARLMRGETPSPPGNFLKKDELDGGSRILFENIKNRNYREYIVWSPSKNHIIQYQKKNLDGDIVTNVLFKDFKEENGINKPGKIIFNFPENKGILSVNIKNSVKSKKKPDKMKFTLPKSVKHIKY